MAAHNKRITQVEARNCQRRCHQLEAKLSSINRSLIEIPEGSLPIAQTPPEQGGLLPALIRNSHQFGHAVLATVDEAGSVIYYALKRGDEI